jgi:hypothetical protein
MSSVVIWGLGLAGSVSLLVVLAALQKFYLHMAVAATVSVVFALASFAELRDEQSRAGGSLTAAKGSAALFRYMGLVWSWGALALVATYAPGILSWREWWQFFLAFVVLGGTSLVLAKMLRSDEATDSGSDDMMVGIARIFAIVILVAMVVTMVGLLVDGKMWRFLKYADRRGWQDWAANNYFFFGAFALSTIAWQTVSLLGWRKPSAG